MNALAAWTTKVAYIVMRLVEFVFLMKHKRDANELAFQRVPFDSSGKKSREWSSRQQLLLQKKKALFFINYFTVLVFYFLDF